MSVMMGAWRAIPVLFDTDAAQKRRTRLAEDRLLKEPLKGEFSKWWIRWKDAEIFKDTSSPPATVAMRLGMVLGLFGSRNGSTALPRGAREARSGGVSG